MSVNFKRQKSKKLFAVARHYFSGDKTVKINQVLSKEQLNDPTLFFEVHETCVIFYKYIETERLETDEEYYQRLNKEFDEYIRSQGNVENTVFVTWDLSALTVDNKHDDALDVLSRGKDLKTEYEGSFQMFFDKDNPSPEDN